MNVEFTKRFQKEFNTISKYENLDSALKKIVETIYSAENIAEIKNLKKLSGYKIYYRIRIGNYRIGLKLEGSTLIFAAFDKRKDIYKRFP